MPSRPGNPGKADFVQMHVGSVATFTVVLVAVCVDVDDVRVVVVCVVVVRVFDVRVFVVRVVVVAVVRVVVVVAGVRKMHFCPAANPE